MGAPKPRCHISYIYTHIHCYIHHIHIDTYIWDGLGHILITIKPKKCILFSKRSLNSLLDQHPNPTKEPRQNPELCFVRVAGVLGPYWLLSKVDVGSWAPKSTEVLGKWLRGSMHWEHCFRCSHAGPALAMALLEPIGGATQLNQSRLQQSGLRPIARSSRCANFVIASQDFPSTTKTICFVGYLNST